MNEETTQLSAFYALRFLNEWHMRTPSAERQLVDKEADGLTLWLGSMWVNFARAEDNVTFRVRTVQWDHFCTPEDLPFLFRQLVGLGYLPMF